MTDTKTIYDTIIIGAGPAGMTVAIYAARANLKVLLIEKGAPGGKMLSTGEIENYTGFDHITGMDLSMKMFEHVQKYDTVYEYGVTEEIIDLGTTKKVVTDMGEYEGKTVVIATGSIERKLNVEGEEKLTGRGISWCAICDGAFYKDRDVVVVGGGNSAVEEAIYLSSICNKVTVVTNTEDLIAEKILQDKLKSQENVEFHYNSTIESFEGDKKLESVKIVDINTRESKDLKVDGAFEFIGLLPATDFVTSLGVTDKYGYIETDEHMETKVKGVFSAGDVRQKNIRQIVTATGDGAIAAQAVLKYIENSH